MGARCLNINKRLLPVKIHYFLFYSALGCALPFRTVFAKQLGISATAVGVIFFTIPFIKMLTNPLFGFLLDFSKRFRLLLSLFMIFVALSHLSMVFIPSKSLKSQEQINFTENAFHPELSYLWSNDSLKSSCYSKLSLNLEYNLSQNIVNKTNNFICDMQCSNSKNYTVNGSQCHTDINSEFKIFVHISDCDVNVKLVKAQLQVAHADNQTQLSFEGNDIITEVMASSILPSRNCSLKESKIVTFHPNINDETKKKFSDINQPNEVNNSEIAIKYINNEMLDNLGSDVRKYYIQSKYTVNFSNKKLCISSFCSLEFNCKMDECSMDAKIIENNLNEPTVLENEYLSVQYRLLFLFMAVSSVALTAVIFIMDAVCYELLQERKGKYGEQRLWGTIGWGIGALIGGGLNQIATSDSEAIDYGPSFYMLGVLALIDLIPLCHLNVKDVKYSSHICKDACFLFSKIDILYNAVIVLCIGVLSGFIWHYEFWFMEEIGSSQVLLGLSHTFEAIFEVPCFIVSGWIISKIGHDNCNSVTLLFFGLRYLCFVFMYNPWWTLAAALLHGPTFGVFYASMTMYAKNEAPPGTEATVQSLLHLCFEGIGVAAGSLLGGVGIDRFGSRISFTYAAGMSFILLFVNVSVSIYLSKKKSESKKTNNFVINNSKLKL